VKMKSRTFLPFWVLVVWLVLLLGPKSLSAEIDGSALWSMEFKSVSISEALKQIERTTGIEIISPGRLRNKVITKSYTNQTVEHILRDIFRDMNCALVWSNGEKGVDSVKILSFDEANGVDASYSADVLRSNASDYPAQEDPAQETEQEQEAEDLTEAESEEKENELTSSSEGSDEELPVPSKKAPRPPDEKIENSAEESPPPIVGQNEEVESGASLPEEEESTSQK